MSSINTGGVVFDIIPSSKNYRPMNKLSLAGTASARAATWIAALTGLVAHVRCVRSRFIPGFFDLESSMPHSHHKSITSLLDRSFQNLILNKDPRQQGVLTTGMVKKESPHCKRFGALLYVIDVESGSFRHQPHCFTKLYIPDKA